MLSQVSATMNVLKQQANLHLQPSVEHTTRSPLGKLTLTEAPNNEMNQDHQDPTNPFQNLSTTLTQEISSSRESSPSGIQDNFFSDSESGSANDDGKQKHLDEVCPKEYELRPGPRSDPENIWTSWQDKDDSGNYDPSAKLQKRLGGKKRKSGEKTAPGLGERPIKKAKIVSSLNARREGRDFVVTLSFQSSHTLSQLQKCRGQDNWPYWPEESYNKLALPDPDRCSGEETLRFWDDSQSYKLRSRYNNDSLFRQFQASSPIDEDLTGHPAARGCVACYKIGETCSLLKNPTQYPCTSCNGECDCELITPPKWKRTCEACSKSKHKKCSYRYRPNDEEEHRLPCLECSESGYHCVAGPRFNNSIQRPSRIDIDFDWESYRRVASDNPEKERRYVACTLCRSNKKRCSLRLEDKPPCRACKEAGFDCTFESLDSTKLNDGDLDIEQKDLTNVRHKSHKNKHQPAPKSSKTPKTAADVFRPDVPVPHWTEIGEDPIEISSSPSTIDPSDFVSRTSRRPAYQDGTFVIQTAFCHPIHFNHEPSPPTSSSDPYSSPNPCHFCTFPHYGIFGLGWREVLVIEWEPGRGYEELKGGHGAQGEEQSRMCTSCVWARTRICCCERHEVRPLPATELTPERMDQEAAFQALMERKKKGQGGQAVEYRWCSVCPSLALHECVTLQETDAFGQPVPPKAKAQVGCGLLLCDACAMTVVAKEGDLHAMLAEGHDKEVNVGGDEEVGQHEVGMDGELKRGSARYPLGWRADAEFLKKDGLLMRAVLAVE